MRHLLQLFRHNTERTLGIDFTGTSIKLLQLVWLNDHYLLENYARVELPKNVIKNGDIQDSRLFVDSLFILLKQIKKPCSQAVVCVPDSCTTSQIIQVSTKLTPSNLEELALMEVDKLIPYPLDEISFDFQLIESNQMNSEFQDLLIVASRTKYINQRVEILKKVGLKTRTVDIESNAILRVLKFLNPNLEDTIAWIDLGSMHTKIFIFHKMSTIFINEDRYPDRKYLENESSFAELQTKIQRSLKFFYSSDKACPIDLILLSGGGVALDNLQAYLQRCLGITVEIARPFLGIKYANDDIANMVEHDQHMLITALGLAMRE
ncbi:MAG: pilus assembly protein PilM [Legionellaceae bacterium]|nr:pilus assembly protein PilM [Legionellaceae bacterium]